MKSISEIKLDQIELLASVSESKKIASLSKRLIVLKCMLGISIFTFVAIVTEII